MSLKLAIMQPYFFPYLGYFQLIKCVDEFVIYDNIEFTKSGWIRRNRILNGDSDRYLVVPVKKASDYSHVDNLEIAESFDHQKMLRVIKAAYFNAPFFNETFPQLEKMLPPNNRNLFSYLLCTTKQLCSFLEIDTQIYISSKIGIDHSLKAQDKVIALCHALNADQYINPIGGKTLYDRHAFAKSGIKLAFHRMSDASYRQFREPFIPNLSIIDVMMFNSKERIQSMLNIYELI